MNNWFEITDINSLDTPTLVVYPNRVKHNIQAAINMVGDVSRLRPHIKTTKSAGVIHLMLEAGITKFKCATIAEAELLGMCKAPDVLLAYQPQGPKLKRFIEVIKRYTGTFFSCLTDSLPIATGQAHAFSAAGLRVPVFLDINTGMNRTGIQNGPDAIELYEFIKKANGVSAGGVHAYDGHMRNADIIQRTIECDHAFSQVEALVESLREKGITVPAIIVGGSPSFPIHAKRKNVECSPGTFAYWDKGYIDLCPEQAFLPAALLVTRIISLPSKTKITTDLGHKSVAAENEMGKRVFFQNATDLKPVSQSEEHLVTEAPEGHSHKVGDVLYALPYHICPTVALYERVITIEKGRISGEWMNNARDRRISL